jgi:hypothetical protein
MSEAEAEREAIARIERALDEAYSRYAGLDEQARVDGLTEALHEALASEPGVTRIALLDQLDKRTAPVLTPVAEQPNQASPAQLAEVQELRREIERLRQVQSEAVPAASTGAERAVVMALAGGEVERLGGSVDGARLAGVVQALAAFARDMVKGFLSEPGKRGDSIVQLDRFHSTVRGELAASLPAGSTAALLGETTQRVGIQLEAFSVACGRGARSLLDELGPELLEDLCGEGGFGPFKYRSMWETFVRRHRELADAPDLFETYFDKALVNAIYQLAEKK